MIVLIAKLLFIIGLPIAAAFVWKKCTRAHWYSLFFGFGAFAVNYLVRIPLDLVLPPLLDLIPLGKTPPPPLNPIVDYLVIWWGIWTYWILQVIISGLFREGTRWLLFRYVATTVRMWRDGVMFGIGYGCIAAMFVTGEYVSGLAANSDLLSNSLAKTVATLNDEFGWWETLLAAWRWGVVLTVFNVGTSLAVLFSVHRRDVRFLLTAVLVFVMFSTAPLAMLFHFPEIQLDGLDFSFVIIFMTELTRLLVTLPPLWLIFRLRKTMGQVSKQ